MARSFWSGLFSFFFESTSPEARGKRLLKQIRKDLKRNTYSRFFKVKTSELQPLLAKFFFETYRATAAAQVLMQNAVHSERLKEIIFNSFPDAGLLDVVAGLSDEAIETRAETANPKELARQLRQEVEALSEIFDPALLKSVDECYNMIVAFIQFVSFDFYFVLKKFDPTFQERNFSQQGRRFIPVKAEQIIEEIKDFLEVSFAVSPDQDWQTALYVMKAYKGGIDVVNGEQWRKILIQMQDIRNSRILELIVRHIEQNPAWESTPKIPNEHIVRSWLGVKRTDIETSINRVINNKRNIKIGKLAQMVFGDADTVRLKNYTEEMGAIYTKRHFDGFIHARALNCFMAFLQDYFNKEIRQVYDLLIVRGKWLSPLEAQPLSNEYNMMLKLVDRLTAFDNTLGEEGKIGRRLATAAGNADRNIIYSRQVRNILDEINGNALDIILQGATGLAVIGQNIKDAHKDYRRSFHELIINWQELEYASPIPLNQWITGIYEKTINFIQILRLFIQDKEIEVSDQSAAAGQKPDIRAANGTDSEKYHP